jgi:hypothetical protein
MGREEEARVARDRFLSVRTKATVKNISPYWPFKREEDKQHFLEGLGSGPINRIPIFAAM